MSSEQEGRQDFLDVGWSKAPGNSNDPPPAAETTGSKETQIRAGTGQNETQLTLPILPIRGIVLFPGMIVPLTIGRPSALKLVDSELPENKQLGLVTQRDEQLDHPEPSDLFPVGVSAQVVKLIRQPDGVVVLIVQVLKRIALESFVQTEPYLRAIVQSVETVLPNGDDTELQASFNNLRRSALKLLELSPEIPDQARAALINVEEPEQLTDLLAGPAPDAHHPGSASAPAGDCRVTAKTPERCRGQVF
jgi:ATP-dependent Lon protease